ncbi:MAG: TIGR02147 family protein [Chitinispirillaceae bacterium]|jgi:uncharacterized protein (TIGR02147 family)
MKSVFEYLDYRDFLKDFYEEKKNERTFFSYRLFGTKVGMDASYLAKVLIKHRHVSNNSIGKIALFCGLNEREEEYFEALVHFVKAKSHKESKVLFERLLSLKSVSAKTLVEHQYVFYQKWYNSAIRSILEFYEFRGNYRALAEQLSPKISVKEAKESIGLLEKLQLIKRDETGRYRMTDSAITTGPQWHSLAIQAFQEETIRLSLESLSRHPKKHRDVSTITMNINGQNFQEIRERIKDFRSTVINYANEQSSPDRVVQLNIQMFPLSKIDGGSE